MEKTREKKKASEKEVKNVLDFLWVFFVFLFTSRILLFLICERQEITKNSTFFLIADDTLDAVYAYNLYPNDNEGIILDPKLTGLTQPRYKPACTSYYNMDANGNSQLRIMVAGGSNDIEKLSNTVEVFHFETQLWYIIEPLPALSAHGTLLNINDEKLLYFGGIALGGVGDGNVYEYSLATSSRKIISDLIGCSMIFGRN